MRVQPSVPAHRQAPQETSVSPDLLEAVIRIVSEAIARQPGLLREGPRALTNDRPDLPALLAPQQVADLFSVSRNTVDRMVEDGELPGIVLREGNRQRMVRVPKGFVLRLLEDLDNGARITLRDYADQWRAAVARQAATGAPSVAAEVA